MEFGRRVVVRPGVMQVERHRDLIVCRAIGFDAGGGAAERAPAIGADRELRRNAAAGPETDSDAIRAGFDGAGFILDALERGKRSGARVECGEQMTVLDIVAEGL